MVEGVSSIKHESCHLHLMKDRAWLYCVWSVQWHGSGEGWLPSHVVLYHFTKTSHERSNQWY